MMGQLLLGLNLPGWETWMIPAIGVTSAGLAIVVGRMLLSRRSPPSPAKPESKPPDPFMHGSATEKRSSPRRGGNPVEVLISDADRKAEPITGWVINRSMGGLCMALSDPLAVETILSVRPRSASGITPWVQVEVRSCRQISSGWEVGCRFLRTPQWSVLLMFG